MRLCCKGDRSMDYGDSVYFECMIGLIFKCVVSGCVKVSAVESIAV